MFCYVGNLNPKLTFCCYYDLQDGVIESLAVPFCKMLTANDKCLSRCSRMSNIIPPLLSSSPPPMLGTLDDEEDEFGGFTVASDISYDCDGVLCFYVVFSIK